MRSWRLPFITAALVVAGALSIVPPQVAEAQAPSTAVLVPANEATVSGAGVVLDAGASAGVTKVLFELTGGSLSDSVIATAKATEYGWIASWDSTTVPNGSYALQSVATASGSSVASSGISITVDNSPTTNILLPSSGSTLSGSTYLDASAANATGVEFLVFGGAYGYAAPVVCTATPTLYGWLCGWNTLSVPDNTYALVAEASNAAGNAFSSVSITINNPTVSFAESVEFPFSSGQAVSVALSRPATDTVQVNFTSADGPSVTIQCCEWVGAASSFSPSSGTVTFAPGQTNAMITLTVNPTTVTGCSVLAPQCLPSVTLTLVSPAGAVLGATATTNVFYDT